MSRKKKTPHIKPQTSSHKQPRITEKSQKNSGEKLPKDILADKLKNKYWVLVLLLGIMVSGFIFWDYVRLDKLYFFKDIGSDAITVTYPSNVAHYNTLTEQEGDVITWSFYYGMGSNRYSGFVVEPQGWLRAKIMEAGVDALGLDFTIYGKIYFIIIFNILTALFFAYAFFRVNGQTKTEALIAGIAAAFMGFLVVSSGWGHAGVVGNGFLFLLAIELFYRKRQWWLLPLSVIYVSGYFYYFLLYGVFLLTYLPFRFALDRLSVKKSLGFLAQMAGLVLVGLGINSVRWLPIMQRMLQSPRGSGDVSTIGSGGEAAVFQIDNFSEQLTAFYRMFSSDFLGNGSYFKGWYNYLEAPLFYVGILMIIVIPQFFALLQDKRSKIIHASFLGFWLLTILVPFLRHAIHGFVGNYYKGPYDFFISFILIFYGVQAIRQIYTHQKIHKLVFLSTIGIILAFILVPFSEKIQQAKETEIVFATMVFIVVYSLIIWFAIAQHKFQWLLPVLLVVFVVEIAYMSAYSVDNRVVYTKAEFDATHGGYHDESWQAVQQIKAKDHSFYRIEKDFFSANTQHSGINDAQAQGYFGTASYSSFNSLSYINFLQALHVIEAGNETQTRWAPGLRGRPLLMTWGNIKYLMTKQDVKQYQQFGYSLVGNFGDVHLMKNNYYLPFGYAYNQGIKRSEFNKLSTFQKDAMLLRAVVIDDADTALMNNLTELTVSDTLTGFGFEKYTELRNHLLADTLNMPIENFSHNRITGTFNNETEKLLFLTIPYHEGWQANVSGTKAEIKRVNIGFSGLKLPPGNHEIELYYVPPFLKMTQILTIVFWAVYLLLIGWNVWQLRNNRALAQ